MHQSSAIKLVALAIVGALTASIPATQGPIAAPAMAGPGCGGHNQRPCIFPFNPCDRGMVLYKTSNRVTGVCKRDEPRGNPPNARHLGEVDIPPTRVMVCNKSNTAEIYVAYAYFDWATDGGQPNWTSVGWWSLQRGECNELRLADEGDYPYDGRIYLMAVGGGLAWEGNGGGFCVDRGAGFRIQDADLVRCTEENTLYGVEFEPASGELNYFDFDY